VKVLLSAYACEPWKGSEPEIGLQTLAAAASLHDVWLIVKDTCVPPLRAYLAEHHLEDQVRIEPLPLGVEERGLGLIKFHRYYERWQRKAAALAVELDRAIDFDVVHHVTLSAYWTRVGVAAVDKPLVLGPLGGAVEVPPRLVTELGPIGAVSDLYRFVGRRLSTRRPAVRTALARTDVLFAQNSETAARLPGDHMRVRVLSNATAVDVTPPPPTKVRSKEIIFAGRLVAWKGTQLAVRTLRHLTDREATLHVLGDGPDLERMQRAARRYGVADRVHFAGWVARSYLLERLSTAALLLNPSVHDEGGTAMAEALSLGTPVVCLDHGGPSQIVSYWPSELTTVVAPDWPRRTVRRLAAAVDHHLSTPPPVAARSMPARTSFAQAVLDAYKEASEC
jgi:glycosyltransferase involved in cell wall biosynthesis